MKRLLAVAAAAVLTSVCCVGQTFSDFLSSPVVLSNEVKTVTGNVLFVGNTSASRDGMAIMPIFSAETTSTTSNLVFTFDVTIDAEPATTNYSTTGPISYSLSSNGSTNVKGFYWIQPTNFVNVTRIKLSKIETTQTNNVTVTAVKATILK
jgi:hypothetical protein